jgi:hypothetical protein
MDAAPVADFSAQKSIAVFEEPETSLTADRIRARRSCPGGTIVRSFRGVNGFFRAAGVDARHAAALLTELGKWIASWVRRGIAMTETDDRLARAIERLDAAVARLERAAAAASASAGSSGEKPAPSAAPGADANLQQRHAQALLGLDATIGRLRTLLDGVERG